MENHHRNSEFSHETWWFSIVFCMFTRPGILPPLERTSRWTTLPWRSTRVVLEDRIRWTPVYNGRTCSVQASSAKKTSWKSGNLQNFPGSQRFRHSKRRDWTSAFAPEVRLLALSLWVICYWTWPIEFVDLPIKNRDFLLIYPLKMMIFYWFTH